MGKLHELLAVTPDLRTRAQQETSRLTTLFSDGRGKLIGDTRVYHPLDEHGEHLEDKRTRLGTTVDSELSKLQAGLAPYIDASVQKEVTNTATSADVVVDGKVFIEGMPAPALLNLEARLLEIKKVYAAIPTLDESERWEWDNGLGCYVCPTRSQYRTQKIPRTLVLYEATEQHPAQVQVFTEDKQIGRWEISVFSGMVTRERKREYLDRVGTLLKAVKRARQRANSIEITPVHVGRALFDYINGK